MKRLVERRSSAGRKRIGGRRSDTTLKPAVQAVDARHKAVAWCDRRTMLGWLVRSNAMNVETQQLRAEIDA